jgi:hypothetical protein
MGLFDFLRGKKRSSSGEISRDPPASMQEALDDLGARLGGKPRFWHYFIAHVALRDFALRGEGLPRDAMSAPGTRTFFTMILSRMAPHLQIAAEEAPGLAAGFVVHQRRVGAADVTIVEMPAPTGPTECHFVALVPRQDGVEQARFFTLEDAGDGVTMLGGWSAEEKHLNYGEGPVPTMAAFTAALAARL